jgi:antirestriction protein
MAEAKVYVGTYKKYNNGSIAGDWLNLFDYADKDDFLKACKKLHGRGEHEYMYQDVDNFLHHIYGTDLLSESHISDKLWELLDEIEYWDDDKIDLFFEWARDHANWSNTPDTRQFEEADMGEFDSERAFAEYMAELNEWPDKMEKIGISPSYFDDDAYATDLFCDGFYLIQNHVFSSR